MYWNLNQRIQDNAVDIGAAPEPIIAQPEVIEEEPWLKWQNSLGLSMFSL